MLIGLAAAAALAGCAGTGHAAESISYETGPCFGACPVYKVTVRSDGTGVFEGRRFTGVAGVRRFRLSQRQYRAFASRLAPVRPTSGSIRYDASRCARVATDMPSVDIVWTGARGDVRRVHYYYGCDMEKNRPLAARLQSAPELLPIAPWIKPSAQQGARLR
jgi:hypothetical protein